MLYARSFPLVANLIFLQAAFRAKLFQGEPPSNKPEFSITFVASSRPSGAECARRGRKGMFHILAVTGAKGRRRGPISKLGELRRLTIRRPFVAVKRWPVEVRIMVTAVEYLRHRKTFDCKSMWVLACQKKPVPRAGFLEHYLSVSFYSLPLRTASFKSPARLCASPLALSSLPSVCSSLSPDLASGVLNCALGFVRGSLNVFAVHIRLLCGIDVPTTCRRERPFH